MRPTAEAPRRSAIRRRAKRTAASTSRARPTADRYVFTSAVQCLTSACAKFARSKDGVVGTAWPSQRSQHGPELLERFAPDEKAIRTTLGFEVRIVLDELNCPFSGLDFEYPETANK